MARPYRPKRWRPELADPAGCYLLSRALSISPVTAQVLVNRGLRTPEQAREFLAAGRSQILDPFRLKGMREAVALIRARLAAGGPILIYGDYDADGVTATATMVTALRALGAQVEYYIPDRFTEGYGLNADALRALRSRGHDFVVTVDTGVSAVAEAELARELGMTLVVTDHHEPGPVLPDVPALVNPRRPDCTYPFKGLAGAGVAFKLALALEAPNVWDLLDIVTLGTVADLMPLVGENRAIVREGLSRLGATHRPGLRALMEVAGVRSPVTAGHVGFALAPRINALGRMRVATEAVELLLTEDPVRAQELARRLDAENRARQETEAAILEEALAQAAALPPEEREWALVLAGEGWHHGVVGICASRVLEVYHRPTILLSIDGDEARGSARSIPGFHIQRALLQMSDLFTKFGGHAAAAGMSLRSAALVGELRRRLNRLAAEWLRPEDLVPEQRVDAFVPLEEVDERLVQELMALEPYGIGNPAPVLATDGVWVADGRPIGREQQHLKLMLSGEGSGPGSAPVEAVGWNMAAVMPQRGQRLAVAYQPELNTYMGRTRVQLMLKDLKAAPGASPLRLTEDHCLAWDPLAGATGAGEAVRRPSQVIDARNGRLSGVLAAMASPGSEVAVSGERAAPAPPGSDAVASGELATVASPGSEAAAAGDVDDPVLAYLSALCRPAEARVLVLTSSPWTAMALADRAERELPDLRRGLSLWLPGEPEPPGGRLVVAAHGQVPRGPYSDVVLYHPPYAPASYPAERLHLLWREEDWALAEETLGWPYPDRDVLVHLYRLLRSGDATPAGLARRLGEIPGPWNRLRFESGMAVFAEIGLVSGDGRLLAPADGVRFDLESSRRYRRGQTARTTLAVQRTEGWPQAVRAI
ncbi:single-stranded-DNA-specific exonuclease [Symbiobacterium terraclitae]|uniref:Single-stranded-DNA-specific exonuclease RecJ n=1 Tax=Symbiobacterium terraclitae TaxID=557451 RepID=A0ABS4JTP5_9FIRM|nr:single-stranded-DNA-specific exonuclease RecJ [Symbiobacterium terraclitae]MBP2018256.1 single-stranded-DNA-specific exonuclease [Symbiobacterium terraclitae]